MGSGNRTRRQITVMTENFNIPKTPIVKWGKSTNKVLNYSSNARYRMVINGQMRYGISDTLFTLQPEKSAFTVNSVISIGSRGNSYISKPHYVMKESQVIPFTAFAPGGTVLVSREKAKTVVEMSRSENKKIDIVVFAPSGGDYFIDIRYANGFNHAYCPTVSVEANTHRQGTIVMPCRGEDEWLNFGWSNIIKAELMRGRNIITVKRIGYLGTELPVLLQSIRISKK